MKVIWILVVLVWYSKCHLVNRPLDDPTTFNHLNTRLVQYLDLHCTSLLVSIQNGIQNLNYLSSNLLSTIQNPHIFCIWVPTVFEIVWIWFQDSCSSHYRRRRDGIHLSNDAGVSSVISLSYVNFSFHSFAVLKWYKRCVFCESCFYSWISAFILLQFNTVRVWIRPRQITRTSIVICQKLPDLKITLVSLHNFIALVLHSPLTSRPS